MLITYVYSGLNMSRWKSGCGNGSSQNCVLDQEFICEWDFWVPQPFREQQFSPESVYTINRQRIGGQNWRKRIFKIAWSQMAGFKKIWHHNDLIPTPSDQAVEWSRSSLQGPEQLVLCSAKGGACCVSWEFFCCVFLLNTVCWLHCQFWVMICMYRIQCGAAGAAHDRGGHRPGGVLCWATQHKTQHGNEYSKEWCPGPQQGAWSALRSFPIRAILWFCDVLNTSRCSQARLHPQLCFGWAGSV